jgi:hypothetical protein
MDVGKNHSDGRYTVFYLLQPAAQERKQFDCLQYIKYDQSLPPQSLYAPITGSLRRLRRQVTNKTEKYVHRHFRQCQKFKICFFLVLVFVTGFHGDGIVGHRLGRGCATRVSEHLKKKNYS